MKHVATQVQGRTIERALVGGHIGIRLPVEHEQHVVAPCLDLSSVSDRQRYCNSAFVVVSSTYRPKVELQLELEAELVYLFIFDLLSHLSAHYAIPVKGGEEGMPLHLLGVVQ